MTRDQINQLWTESATVADFLIAIGVVKVDEEPKPKPKAPRDRHYDSQGYCDNPGRGY